MLLIIIFFFTIGLLPVTFMLLQVMQQKIDFKKHGKKNETYIQFCERNYTRYI